MTVSTNHIQPSNHSLRVCEVSCIRQQQLLFQPVSFELQAGEGIWIEGPNGIGKSSLLRTLAGFSTCQHGELFWNDSKQIHYLGHADGIRSGLTVYENLHLTATLAEHNTQALQATLASLQLTALQHQQTKYLSAGQKRRVALGKLLLVPRTLWILDEPLTALDSGTQQIVLQQIDRHLQAGGICVMTSHQTLPITLPQMRRMELSPC